MNDNKIIISPKNHDNCSFTCKNLKIFYTPRCIKFFKTLSFTGEYMSNLEIKRCADCLKLTNGEENEK
jgi:hypothetical protein